MTFFIFENFQKCLSRLFFTLTFDINMCHLIVLSCVNFHEYLVPSHKGACLCLAQCACYYVHLSKENGNILHAVGGTNLANHFL